MDKALPDNFEIYCFDYYDTIARRSVEPEYVKKIWCKELKDFLLVPLGVEELYLTRNKLEASLCAENEKNGYDLEFRYQDLAVEMYKSLDLEDIVACDFFCRRAVEIELGIECRVQIPCEDVISEIKRLKGLGKRIICISDFYTPAQFLRALLEYHNIEGLFDEIYVSSELLITKRSGRLYDYVLEQMNVSPDKICMTGDNKLSDYEMPVRKGMSAFHLERESFQKNYREFKMKHETSSYVEQELEKIYKECRRNQYEDLAFALYCFIDKLYARLRKGRIQDVFFLSREGEFLKKIFDRYQEPRTRGGVKPIRSHYLMVSRKATFIASLKPLEEEEFEMIFRQYVNISLYDFLSSLGFEEEIQKEIGVQLNVDIHEKQNDLPRTKLYDSLCKNPCFVQNYEKLRTEQRQNFSEYLESFGVDYEGDGMCLVDVGWKGTIQDNILMFFGEKIKILGLYLGLVAPGKVHPNNLKEGLLFTNIPYPQKNFYVYDENKSVFEVMLGASHGSADHYVRSAQGIKVATSEKNEEKELFRNVISPMQEGIYGCVERIDDALINHCFDKERLEKFTAKVHARLVFFPKKEQMDLFYRIYHYENFGVFEFTKFKKANGISVQDRIRNIKKMLTQRRVFFQSSFWGIIALKDAGLGILVRPYGCYMYNKCYRKENE
ncbi:MAG: HAD-IA family hydrolase [Lachnospiraceae bacterium]|nr:HAD-IA family hydrolase [Lachnospiraceae bacterium]